MFGIDETKHTDEAAIGCRDDHGVDVMLAHAINQPGEVFARANGGWSGLHNRLDRGVRIQIIRQSGGIDPAMHDAGRIADDTTIPATPGQAFPDLADAVGQQAGRSIAIRNAAGAWHMRVSAFGR